MMTNAPQRGFTLIETMVAVALLAITIVLPYVAIQKSLTATYIARDELIAASLAQEALEYVRAVRDANYLHNLANPTSQRSWLFGMDGSTGSVNCVGSTKQCTVDPTLSSAQIKLCTSSCPVLQLTSAGRYVHAPGVGQSATPTSFSRYFRVETINSHEVKVTATVTWNNKGQRTVVISDILQDWL